MDGAELEAYVTVTVFLINGNDIGVHDARVSYQEFKPLVRAAERGLCHRWPLGPEWARFFLPNRAAIEKYTISQVWAQEEKKDE